MILISIDTLRADHLGFWGYERDTSPNLDRLARESWAFKSSTSQAPHTIPSLLQLMTGQFFQHERIAPESTALAEYLKLHGYRTAAVVDNPIVELQVTDLQRGFDHFYANDVLDRDQAQQHWKTKMPADVITRQAVRWLDEHAEDERPFFLWLHYFDPHDPYMPPFTADLPFAREVTDTEWTGDIRNTFLFQPSRPGSSFEEKDRQHLVNLYDAEIYYVDQALGDLFAHLEETELFDASLIVVTADHGEAFGERGRFTHGKSVHQEEIHVPLVVKPPFYRDPPREVLAPTQNVDILPTITSLVGIDPPARVDGRDLSTETPERAHVIWRDWVVLRTERYKLLSNEHTGETMLFDLVEDPGETRNLAAEEPEILRELVAEKDAWLETLPVSAEEVRRLSREEVERLEALGYL